MIPSGATVLFLLEASRFRPFRHAHPFSYCPLAFGWHGVASRHFRHLPRPSPRWSMPRAPWFFSCGRATAPPIIRSPVHLPRHLRPAPQAHSRPSSSISRSHSRTYCHAFLCSHHSVSVSWSSRSFFSLSAARQGVSGPRVVQPFIFTRYPLPGGRIRTASGPGVHLHSLSAAKKAYPDPEWSSRSSSLATRRQEGVSGSREVQPFIFSLYPLPGRRLRIPGGPAVHLTRYPPPGRRIRTPSGPAVHLYLPSAARKAYPDRGWSRRSSSLAIRLQEGVSGPRLVQAFIVTRYPPPGRRIRTATGPGVYLHSLYATRRAYPDPEWSRRSSSLAIRLQEGVSGPRVVQAFIFTRYPPPGMCIRTPSGPGVHPHSLSASRKPYRDPQWSSRSFSLAVRCQEGVSEPRMVQPFIFTHCLPPGSRIQTATGPTVHLHSLSAARKAYPNRVWSSRSSSLAVRLQEGVSGPRVVQPFIFTRYPPLGRRILTPSGPAVPLHRLSAARKASPDPERSSRSSSLAIRRQEGVPGPRVVQPFIFTRYPPPGRRIGTPSGPSVHLHSLSGARNAVPDRDWSRRSSSPAVRRQEGVPGPRAVQSFIFTRYPPPGRRTWTPSGPAVHIHSLSAARKAYRDPQWSIRSSSVAIRRQECGSGPRLVQAFIFARLSASRKAYTVPRGQPFFLTRLSAVRRTHADRGWSSRSCQLAYLPPGSRIRFAHAFRRSS